MIVLDTNVVLELLRPRPATQVQLRLSSQDGKTVYFTAVGEAELRHGVAVIPAGRRRTALSAAIDGITEEDFRDRILPFDRAVALAYADIATKRRAVGRPISPLDCQIAAITRTHGASVATRNTADYEDCGFEIMNPWMHDPSI